jgi:hypothetical protein
MTRTPRRFFLTLLGLLCIALMVQAQEQTQLAATLEVLKAGVEVKRVDTPNWIPVKLEAIVGVGDEIRTNATGSARITFFADGVDTDILPNTTYRIAEFKGSDESFTLSAEVLVGQTTQRLGRTLDANSSYNITTPGMTLAARGTRFSVRVEDTGRAGMLVQEGTVAATNDEAEASVPPEFGIRAVADEALSDVVRASTFDELDAALDGCSAQMGTFDDVRLNVRLGPDRTTARVGTLDPADLSTLVGINTNENDKGAWYRVPFNGGYGWVLSSSAKIDTTCAGLREFAPDWREDASLYTALGETISLDVTPATPEATLEPTAEATAEGE